MTCAFHRLHWESGIDLQGYFQPKTLREALEILNAHRGRARVIAGGTDVIPQLRRKELQVDYLVDLTGISGMGGIALRDGILSVGAMVTHSQICSSELLRKKALPLVEGAEALGSPQIRNVSTVGGNLVSGQPAADSSLPLLALQASLRVVSIGGERTIPLSEFFQDQGQTAVDPRREILTEISFPALRENQGAGYLRLSKRNALSLPILALAVVVTLDSSREKFEGVALALGPVAPTPFRAMKTEAMLKGAAIGQETLQEAAKMASEECQPRSSLLRGSADYRKEMVKVLVRRGLAIALARAGFSSLGDRDNG